MWRLRSVVVLGVLAIALLVGMVVGHARLGLVVERQPRSRRCGGPHGLDGARRF